MKSIHIICLILTVGLLAGGLSACCSTKCKDKEAKLEAQAKVTRAEAEKTALAGVLGGTIKEGEIEKEKGKLIWSFDITTPDSKDITEVTVDAITGKVLSTEKETPEQQEKEKQEEAKEKK